MDLNSLPIFAMMNKQMSWLSERQKVLAQNIANSDTPGYRPSDLLKIRFRDILRPSAVKLELSNTSSGHIEANRSATNFRGSKQKTTYETAPDGNAVVIEEQLLKVSETQGNYRLATNLYRKHVNMFKIALGQGR